MSVIAALPTAPARPKADGVSEPAAEDPTTLEDADYAEAALSRMRPRASAYIRRIANGETLVDIAAAEGRSPQRIRQVVTAAREKIRSQMQAA
jgi:DNA-binding CsgD family transcriptional regulator